MPRHQDGQLRIPRGATAVVLDHLVVCLSLLFP